MTGPDDRVTTYSDVVSSPLTPAALGALLERVGWSGRELARRLDVSPMWVSRRLSGEVPISMTDADRILRAVTRPRN